MTECVVMFKACSKCGKIHDVNQRCHHDDTHKDERQRKLRSKYIWTLKSREVREKANYLCEVCRDQGKIVYDNVEVHHILPLRDYHDLFLENNNLICLCATCHKKAEKNQIDKDYLIKLAELREKNPPPKN